MTRHWRSLALLAGGLLFGAPALAQSPSGSVGSISPVGRWAANGQLLFDAPGGRDGLLAVRDGSGGVYLAWRDLRDRPEGEVYVTHLASNGQPIAPWPASGLRVREAVSGAPKFGIAPGIQGGLYVVVHDGADSARLYAHHFPAAAGWPEGGVAIDLEGKLEKFFVIDEGFGTLGFATVVQKPDGTNEGRMRRRSYTGWPLGSGVVLSSGSALMSAIGDGQGHSYFVFHGPIWYGVFHNDPDLHHTAMSAYQRGTLEWIWSGPAEVAPAVFGDPYQGVVAYHEETWTAGAFLGRLLLPSGPAQLNQLAMPIGWLRDAAPDGQGGAVLVGRDAAARIVAYRDNPSVPSPRPTWWTSGVVLYPNADRPLAFVKSDLRGGVFVGSTRQLTDGQYVLYGQHLLNNGQFDGQWTPTGDVLHSGSGAVTEVTALLDGAGGYFVFWLDTRDGQARYYGQSLGPPGFVDVTPLPPASKLALALPRQPARAGDRVRCTLASDAPATLAMFDVRGRLLWRESLLPTGPGVIERALPAGLARGVTWLRLKQGTEATALKLVALP